MDDLISRQRLLEYIHGEPVGRLLCDKYNLDGLIEQLPSAQPKKRTQERTETHACDCINRQAAINAIDECYCGGEDSCGEPWIYQENAVEAIQMVEPILSAEPKIIRCKDCKYASGNSRICLKLGHSPIGELDFCSYAERREDG